jgi:predicted nucleic acid-binding protein
VTAEVFLDTSFLVALAITTDQLHGRAKRWSRHVKAMGTRLVTTRAVLLEIGNTLGKQRFRPAAIQLLSTFETDPKVNIVPLTDSLYARAFDLYKNRPDKDWGMTDCVSFVVMGELHLTEALTADQHFEQAGFTALLGRDPD